MNKRKWLIAISPLFFTWAVDQATKLWASKLLGLEWFGIFGFMLHHNHGAILGLFSDMPPVLRIVSLATGGAFLFFLFFIIQFLLPSTSLLLRAGLSFLLGGILGNVTDRILHGFVIDFILIGYNGSYFPVFNLADALQWIGYVCVVIALIKDGKKLWPVDNARKSYWINVKFQLKYCLSLMAFSLFLSIIAGTYSYTYLKVTINELRGPDPYMTKQLLGPFIVTFAIVSVTSAAILFVAGLILSHRAAGPLYAFERFINDYIAGRPKKLKLRTGDDFMHLEKVAERLTHATKVVAPEPQHKEKNSSDEAKHSDPAGKKGA